MVDKVAEKAGMSIEEACFAILGDKCAHDMIADLGINWTVVAAMAAATTADSAEAIATIRDWNKAQRP